VFYVTPTLSAGTDVILGIDLLQQFQCVIDLSKGTVDFYDGLVTVGLQRRRNAADLCATMPYDYVLPANTEIILSLNVPSCLSDTTYIAEPCRKAIDSSVIAARALVEPVKGKVNCRMVNTSNKPVSLRRNTVIATLHEATDYNIVDYDSAESENPAACDMFAHIDIDNADQATLNDCLEQIGVDITKSCLTDAERLQLSRLIVKYADIFATDISQLRQTNAYSHKVDTGDALPQRTRMHRYSPSQKAEIERQVSEMLKSDLIFPSNSLWQASVVLVSKKHTDLSKPPPPARFTVDFRKLNAVTRPLSQTMIDFNDVIDAIGSSKATVFSGLDFFSGFFQIGLSDRESMERCSSWSRQVSTA